MTDDRAFKDEGFADFFVRKRRKKSQSAPDLLSRPQQDQMQRSIEPAAVVSHEDEIDGRISTKVDANGLVQLNTRVPLAVKKRVLEERKRRRSQARERAGLNDIITDALLAYLPKD